MPKGLPGKIYVTITCVTCGKEVTKQHLAV